MARNLKNDICIEDQRVFWERERPRRSPSHEVIAAFAEPVLDCLWRTVGSTDTGKNQRSILDVGCGNGFFSYYLEQRGCVTCLDFSQTMLQLNPSRRCVRALAESMPFGDGTFDLVFCSNLLHHAEDPLEITREMARLSKRFVAVSEPNRNSVPLLNSLLKREERGGLKFSLSYTTNLLDGAGLRIREAKTMGVILPNKTPSKLLPFVRILNRSGIWGFYSLVVGEKE